MGSVRQGADFGLVIRRGDHADVLAVRQSPEGLRLAEDGIGVFEVRPGIIRTDMTAGVAGKYERLIGEGVAG